MRVYTYKQTIVNLRHFKFCSKHMEMLIMLQHELPNIRLELDTPEGHEYIPIHELNLEDARVVRQLNI